MSRIYRHRMGRNSRQREAGVQRQRNVDGFRLCRKGVLGIAEGVGRWEEEVVVGIWGLPSLL